MWLLRSALRKPISVVVLVIGVALCSILALTRMPIDIFPNLNLPVIYVAQPYGGMSPAQMEGYLVYYYEYHFLYITGIRVASNRNPSRTWPAEADVPSGHGHEPGDGSDRSAMWTGRAHSCHRERSRRLSCGFDAGSVPVGYLVFSSPTRVVAEIQDLALNRVRPALCDPARSFGASAVRGSGANDCGQRRPGPSACLPHVARGSGAGSEYGKHDHARGKCSDRRFAAAGADQFGGLEYQGLAESSDSHGRWPDRFPSRRRHGRGFERHRHRLCRGEWTAHGLHSGRPSVRMLRRWRLSTR